MVRTRYPDVTLLTSATNLGAAGRNHGVRLATTPYVAFCDDDTWYEPGALGRAADLLDAHPDLAVVTANVTVEPDGRPDEICLKMAASPPVRIADIPGCPLLSFLGGASIVRRRAFLATGGFSSQLWLDAEEKLLACDLARAGWQLSYVPGVVAHQLAPRLADAQLRGQRRIRNTLWFIWLRRPPRSAAVRTIRLLCRLSRDQSNVRGVMDAFHGLPWVPQERDPVAANLERSYRQLERSRRAGSGRRDRHGSDRLIQRVTVNQISSQVSPGRATDVDPAQQTAEVDLVAEHQDTHPSAQEGVAEPDDPD